MASNPTVTERRYYDDLGRLKVLEPAATRAKKAIESGEAAEMKLMAFDRIAELVRRAPGSDHSMLLGQIAEAIERVNEPQRVIERYESLKQRLASHPMSVVDDDQKTSN